MTDILAKANEACENVLYIGDSDVDMQTAQNAGVKACAVTWGFRSRAVLAASRPNYIISTPQEILSLL